MLRAPANDIAQMERFLTKKAGFDTHNITVLFEHAATRANIIANFRKIVQESKPKDVVFIQYSGHGGRTTNNLHILPVDSHVNGTIRDEDIMKDLIKAMPKQVHTTMLMDSCYSGTLGDRK